MSNFTPKQISIILWLSLGMTTLLHAGLMVAAMLSYSQPPSATPGTPQPPLAGPAANAWTFWAYLVVLGINIWWENRFKGQRTYIRSNFPLPEFLYSDVALILWAGLEVFAHVGHWGTGSPVPDWLNKTFWSCFVLLVIQKGSLEELRNPEGETKEEIATTGVKATSATSKVLVADPSVNPSAVITKTNVKTRVPATSQPAGSDQGEITEKVMEYVRQNGQAKTSGLMEFLGIPRRTVIRNLNKLLEQGSLMRVGSGPGAVYRLKESSKD